MHRTLSAARSLTACVLLTVLATLVLAGPAGAAVSVDGDFASLDTFQALNSLRRPRARDNELTSNSVSFACQRLVARR